MTTAWWLSSNPDLYPTDADLAAQRERRGEPVAWQVVGANGWNTAPTRDMDEATRDAAQYNGYDTSSWIDRRPFTVRPLYAAPPLPPAPSDWECSEVHALGFRDGFEAAMKRFATPAPSVPVASKTVAAMCSCYVVTGGGTASPTRPVSFTVRPPASGSRARRWSRRHG